jgi:hypothetical protein
MEAVCSSETMVSTYKSTWATTLNTNIDIFTALRTSDLTTRKLKFLHSFEIYISGQQTGRQKLLNSMAASVTMVMLISLRKFGLLQLFLNI